MAGIEHENGYNMGPFSESIQKNCFTFKNRKLEPVAVKQKKNPNYFLQCSKEVCASEGNEESVCYPSVFY